MTTRPTISETLQLAQQKLCSVSDAARLDAEILLSQALDCTRTYLRTWPQHTLTFGQHERFLSLLTRRSNGEPIAYITGQREFWDMTLQVSPDTLIPRPETEHLVELALEKIPQEAQWRIADLGTGCGAIALAIARERPHCKIIATDSSTAALTVARNNARNLDIRDVTFIKGHWFEPLGGQQFEMIVSNPPYIHPNDQHLSQGDLRFEPVQALRSAPDGLADIQVIAEDARKQTGKRGLI
jgi:release factor glutamine methyltransferase